MAKQQQGQYFCFGNFLAPSAHDIRCYINKFLSQYILMIKKYMDKSTTSVFVEQ